MRLKSVIWLFSIFHLVFAQTFPAHAEDSDGTLSGEINLNPKLIANGGEIYLNFGGSNATSIPIVNDRNGRVQISTPEQFSATLTAGSVRKDKQSFAVKVPPGTYNVMAFIKGKNQKGPRCEEVKAGTRSIFISCFPTEGDVVCSNIQTTVKKNETATIIIGCGAKAEESGK